MNKRLYLLGMAWLLVCVVALWFANSRRAIVFDPQGVLQTQSAQSQLLERFAGSQKPRLILVTDSQCQCAQVSQTHQNKVEKQALALGVEVEKRNAAEFDNQLLPSVPAVLFMTATGELSYAGPLSVGLGCAISDGIIDVVLANYARGYQSSLFISDAKGCYCRNNTQGG